MKKIILTSLAFAAITLSASAQILMGKTTEISFFSTAPLEDITAINKTTKPVLNTATGDVLFKISIQGFSFEKALMQEHFNENYMESEKFPHAMFKGKINEKIDYKTNGTTKVTVTGKLTVHGVEKERTIEGTVTVKDGAVTIDCKFNIALKDHNIAVPELMFQKIGEVVAVTIKTTLTEGGK
jgi:polyisoprenoid-binding protein YceI